MSWPLYDAEGCPSRAVGVDAVTTADLIEDGLAVYRLARLVTRDRITKGARDALIASAYARRGVYMPIDADPETWHEYQHPDAQPLGAYLVTCGWCVGLWAALGAGLVRWVFGPDAWRAIRRPLAAAAVAGLVQTLEDR